ncbi:hypothetical protein BIW11_00541, partial [Tropilaelaps mercedesae]
MSDSESDPDVRSRRRASRKEQEIALIFGSDSDTETKKRSINTSPRSRRDDKFEALLKLPAGDSKTTEELIDGKKRHSNASSDSDDCEPPAVSNGRTHPKRSGDPTKKAGSSSRLGGTVKAPSDGGGDTHEEKLDEGDAVPEEDAELRNGRRGKSANGRASS